jgi:hypothetical protein
MIMTAGTEAAKATHPSTEAAETEVTDLINPHDETPSRRKCHPKTGDPTAKDTTMEVHDDDKTVQSKGSGAKIEEKLTEFLIKLTIRPKQRRTQLTQTEALRIHHGLCGAILNVPGNVINMLQKNQSIKRRNSLK